MSLSNITHVRCMKCRTEATGPNKELVAAGWFIKMGGELCPTCRPT